METKQNSFFAPRIVLGLGIILIGVLFLLGNMDIIDSHDYVRFWPVILVIVGLQCCWTGFTSLILTYGITGLLFSLVRGS